MKRLPCSNNRWTFIVSTSLVKIKVLRTSVEISHTVNCHFTLRAEPPWHPRETKKGKGTLPKSCIFFEVAAAQVLGQDKPVLFLSDRFCCARLCLNARAVTNTWAHIIKHMQMNLIVKTRSTDSSTLEYVTDHCHYWDQYLHFITTMKSWTKP